MSAVTTQTLIPSAYYYKDLPVVPLQTGLETCHISFPLSSWGNVQAWIRAGEWNRGKLACLIPPGASKRP